MDDDKPNGGFPPIFECKNKDDNNTTNKSTKIREFVPVKSAISIKDIMKKKEQDVKVDLSS